MPRVTSQPLPLTASAGQLAAAIGVTERAITGRRSDGRLPATEDGKVDLRAVLKAGVEALAAERRTGTGGKLTLEQAKIDLLVEQRDHRRMLNEQMRGEAVMAEDMETAVGAMVDAAKARMLALPSKLAPLLLEKTNPAEVKNLLTEAVHDACGELARDQAAAAVRHRAFVRAGGDARDGADTGQVGPGRLEPLVAVALGPRRAREEGEAPRDA